MQRTSLVYLMLFILPLTAGEQDPLKKNGTPWSFGFSGGFNYAGMYGGGIRNIEDDYMVTPRPTGNGGIYLSYALLPWLPLEVGAEINGKGFQYWDNEYIDGMPVDFQFISKNVFFEVPVCFRPTATIGRTKLSCIAGMSYAGMFGAERDLKARIAYNDLDTTIDIYSRDYFHDGVPIPLDTFGNVQRIPYKELYRTYDFSLCFGFGFERMLQNTVRYDFDGNIIPQSAIKSAFYFDARYYIGLLDIQHMTSKGEQHLNEAYGKLFQFFEENNIDPADMGFGPSDMPERDPVYKFSTLSLRAGFRFYF